MEKTKRRRTNRHEQTKYERFLEKMGLQFNNMSLLIQAFTHSSYVNEHRKKDQEDNERLEFLGDAVLELTVSQYLFRAYPTMKEGELTKLRAAIVCEPSLEFFAKSLDFGKLIRLGRGEELTGGRNRPALLADAFEAFIGALFLDQGLEEVIRFLEKFVFPKIQEGAFSHMMDYKSQLQEQIQHDGLGSIEYEIIDEKGPAHNREFVALVKVGGTTLGKGSGKSKKEAEQRAAEIALKALHQGFDKKLP